MAEDPEWLKEAVERNKKEAAELKAEAAQAYEDIVGDRFKPKPKPEDEK